ncbi:hypothetical protein [Chlorobium limicola]|uniref:Phosphate-selective porin O and P n=1 Tax=Chlorobium limicola TaxID=1092 RepID=A0A101JUT3_CHLLI|nr:hypothetical protein [Chlorobium limicola]KUL32841.1 hypothetical protein ASB62_01035 [Chlorobium limicola]
MALHTKSITRPRFQKSLTHHAFRIIATACILITGGTAVSLGNETTDDTKKENSTLSLRISGEYEYLDTRDTIINPSNILQRPENRIETFILGEMQYKAPGGNVKGEFRFGYQNLFSSSDDFSDENTYNSQINQLYYQSSSSPLSFLIGRKKVRWGVSYAYSPTDLISQTRTPEDPDDRLNLVKGADLMQLSWIRDNGQFDLIYAPDISWNFNDSFIRRNRIGMRIYQLVEPFDISVVGRLEEGGNWAAGCNTTVTFGDALELHAEYVYNSASRRSYPNLDSNPSSLVDPFFNDRNGGTHEIVLGGQYTFPGKWNLVMEYLFRSAGLSDNEFTAYSERLDYLDNQMSSNPAATPYFYEAVSYFSVPSNRNYLFTRLYQPEITKHLSCELFSYVNLDDGSGMCVFMPKYESGNNYDIYLRVNKFWGGNNTEFGMVPDELSGLIGFSYYLL